MSEHEHHENDYTDRDIRLKPLVIFLAATLLVTAITIVGVYVLFHSYSRDIDRANTEMDQIVAANRPTNAVVEGSGEAAEAMRQLRAEENARLQHYQWVDEQAKVVQIPIERAMEKVVEKGLPVRKAVTPVAIKDETPVEAGARVFTELGCIACHGEVAGALGPSLKGVFGHAVSLADGSTVIADETYVRESILEPLSKLVAGYAPVMPAFKGIITDTQLEQVMAYVKSLGSP